MARKVVRRARKSKRGRKASALALKGRATTVGLGTGSRVAPFGGKHWTQCFLATDITGAAGTAWTIWGGSAGTTINGFIGNQVRVHRLTIRGNIKKLLDLTDITRMIVYQTDSVYAAANNVIAAILDTHVDTGAAMNFVNAPIQTSFPGRVVYDKLYGQNVSENLVTATQAMKEINLSIATNALIRYNDTGSLVFGQVGVIFIGSTSVAAHQTFSGMIRYHFSDGFKFGLSPAATTNNTYETHTNNGMTKKIV